ncbi:MAG: cation/acetate symporter ActP [Akkermansiaceae bacterium]|nr:cation/acetate symporter ActP [Akkermansiaceae bacterium]
MNSFSLSPFLAQAAPAADAAPTVSGVAVFMFAAFVAMTLAITWWAARKSSGAGAFFAAGRRITGWQNGLAVAGDYMSAASFLGIAGMIAFFGFDGFLYSVGFLVAYLTVLLIVAEPLRNLGKYTMADVLAFRNREVPVRALASLSTLCVTIFYMIAQMVGAGLLVNALIPGDHYNAAVTVVGLLMIVYVVFGGMLATTWVQIVKAVLLMLGSFALSLMVMNHFGFSIGNFFDAVGAVSQGGETRDFMTPGFKFKGTLDLVSLCLALVMGTAGLPHILIRFYTVPDAKTARSSVIWATIVIGLFYLMTTFFGFGAATIIGPDNIANSNLSAPLLAQKLGGEIFFAFICAVAFATILAVVAGLTISASTSFAHDIFVNVIHHGREHNPGEEIRVARVTAFAVGIVSILLAIVLRKANVAFLVGLAFAVAASANLPAILLTLFWKRFNTNGAVWALAVGLVSSIVLIVLGPSVMKENPVFPLGNPALVSIPLGLVAAVIGTLLKPEPSSEAKYAEMHVRAHTGLGAEQAEPH